MQKLLKTCGMRGGVQSNSSLKQRIKRGFTIMELVIVIAVIAVLAAVLIPTFANVIERANLSNDTGTVRNINEALLADEVLNGKAETMGDALRVAREAGYDIDKISPSTDGYIYAWDDKENQFMLLENNDGDFSVYYPEGVQISAENTWVIADDDNYADFQREGYHIFQLAESSEEVIDRLTSGTGGTGEVDYILLSENIDMGDTTINLNSNLSNVTLDLNGNSLSVKSDANAASGITVQSGATLTLANGTVKIDETTNKTEHAGLSVIPGGSLTLDNVNLDTSEATGIFVQNEENATEATELIINNSQIEANAYCVGTNAYIENQLVNISITDSILNGNGETALMINVPGELNAANTTFIGGMQSVIVRGGGITATFNGCGFENNVTYNGKFGWQAGLNSATGVWMGNRPLNKWDQGNCIPMACLTIGNDKGNTGYACGTADNELPTTVTLTNCTFEATGEDSAAENHKYMTVYLEGSDEYTKINLNYDSATAASIDGTGYGLVYGANVVINGAAMHGEGDCNRIYAANLSARSDN